MVLQAPQRDRKHCVGGHGLTTAAREDPLPWERQGSRGKGGEASARLSNGWRVYAAPKDSVVKASQDGLGLAHQRTDRGLDVMCTNMVTMKVIAAQICLTLGEPVNAA